jgi:hypothetical protein
MAPARTAHQYVQKNVADERNQGGACWPEASLTWGSFQDACGISAGSSELAQDPGIALDVPYPWPKISSQIETEQSAFQKLFHYLLFWPGVLQLFGRFTVALGTEPSTACQGGIHDE